MGKLATKWCLMTQQMHAEAIHNLLDHSVNHVMLMDATVRLDGLTSTAAERPRSLRSPNQARALAGSACSTPLYTTSASLHMLAASSATPANMPMCLQAYR